MLHSLDNLANNIASATFDVINSGKVRTADMGGTYYYQIQDMPQGSFNGLLIRLCDHIRVHQCNHQKPPRLIDQCRPLLSIWKVHGRSTWF